MLSQTYQSQKLPCPKCGKLFQRLERHLRSSATCKETRARSSEDPPTSVIHELDNAFIYDVATPNSSTKDPSTSQLLPNLLLPKSTDVWLEAEKFFHVEVVPKVCNAQTVDDMNSILCTEIYCYFANKYQSLTPHLHHHQHHHHHHQH